MQQAIFQRLVFAVLVALLAGVLPAGCGRPAARSEARQEARLPVVGVSLCGTDNAWHKQMKADIEASAARHPDLRMVVEDAGGDAARQQAHLAQFLADRVKAVIVCPQDPQIATASVAKLIDAGIPVVVLDRSVIGDKYACLVAADPEQIGQAAGRWLAERLAGKGKIVELRGPTDSHWDQQVQAAWRAALRDPGYRFVFSNPVDLPAIDGAKLMQEALDQIEQIDAVLAYDDAAAAAAHKTAKAAGREKGTLFVGVGGLPGAGAAYVSQGALNASILHPTGGAEAVDAAAKLIRGEKPPKKIVPPARVIAAGP